MKRKPPGWRNEPYRHSLAAHGVSTRNQYRVQGIPNQRVNIHGMKMSRWRCPECYRGLKDGICVMHGGVGSQVDILNSPHAQNIAFDIRIWKILDENPDITIPHLAKKIGMDEPTLREFLNRVSDKVDGTTYLDDYRRAYPLRSRGDQMGPNEDDYYDYGEESIFFSQQSDEKCRTCGRRGCEGGPSCEMAAEMRDDRLESSGNPIVLDIKGRGSFDGDLRISLEGAEELAPLLKSKGVAMQAWSAFKSDSGTQKIEGNIKGVNVDLKVTHPGENLYHVEGDMDYHIDRTFTREELTGFYRKAKELM